MEMMGLSTNAFIGLLAFFILNVIINLYLLNRIFNEQRKNRQLKKSAVSNEGKIKEFFDSQVLWSRSKVVPGMDLLPKQAWNLRVAYAKIESQALVKPLDSPAYQARIVEPLIRLLKTLTLPAANDGKSYLQSQLAAIESRIKKLPVVAGKEQVREKALKTLNDYKLQIDNSSHSSAELSGKVKKLNRLMTLFEDPASRKTFVKNRLKAKYVSGSVSPIKRLTRSQAEGTERIAKFERDVRKVDKTEDLLEEIQRFKSENKKLQDHITNLKKNMIAIKSKVIDDAPEPFLDDAKKPNSSENDGYSDSLLAANESEIDRLRDVISGQRRSILEMEGSLSKFENVTLESDDGAKQVEKMKQCIRESETCITILEGELESLKNSLDQLKSAQHDELSDIDIEQMNIELERAQNDLRAGDVVNTRLKTVLDFVKELFTARTVEDISLLVYEIIMGENYSPNIILKSANRNLIVSSTGDISIRDKVTINNMRLNEMNIGQSGQLSFRLLHLAGVIRPNNPEVESEDVAKDVVIEILRFADQCVDLLLKAQENIGKAGVAETAINGLKDIAFNVDQMLDDQAARTVKLVKTNMELILDVAKAKGVGASIISKINQIEQETVRQMGNENTIKLKTRRQLLALVSELENTIK